jgi:Ca-activated chloride channel homolog
MLASCATARGQETPTFSVESQLVVLHVTVKDRAGGYVTDLPREAFRVLEEGRAQALRFSTDTDTPITLGLLIDNSWSMAPNRRLLLAGAAAFAEAMRPQDELFALAFNETVSSALPAGTPFTSDSELIHAALEGSITARGQTALYDAISAGLGHLRRGTRERKVLVVVSDGGDNASRATRESAIRQAQESNAVIYTIALVDPLGARGGNPAWLKELAQASGGESFRPKDARGIADALRAIVESIRHTYTLGYVSDDTARGGPFRSVRVVVTAPSGRQLVVRARAGYVAGRGPVGR